MHRAAKGELYRTLDKVAASFRAARRLMDPKHDGGGPMTAAERENVHGRLTTTVEFDKRARE